MRQSPFKYSEFCVYDWNELSATMKAEMVLNAIDELYFPYTDEIVDLGKKTYNNYWDFADDTAKLYDLINDNSISFFWGTEWSEPGKREKFTGMVKEIVDNVVVRLYGVNIHEYFMEHSYFTAWKSHSVELIYEDEPEEKFIFELYEPWDTWKLGYIELIVQVINHLED